MASSIGSTLDVNSLVSQLMQVEQRPLTRLAQREASYQAKLSAFGSLSGAISSFQSSMSTLADSSRFLALKATPSDTSILNASSTSAASPGSYSIEVTQLAQQQKLVADGKTSASEAIGTGTLSFDFGTITIGAGSFNSTTGKYTGASFASAGGGIKTVTIDSTNNTLSGIRDAINAAAIGVSATIVNDGSATPYRLVLTSDTSGSANSVKIAVSGDVALSNLLGHDPSSATQNLAERVTAQNAELKVDGLAVSKASNTLTDVIAGVTLNLARTNAGSAISLSVARDASVVQSSVQGFVDATNTLIKALKDLTGYDPATKRAGPLQGDSTARSIDTSIRSVLATALTGAGSYTSLSQLGVAFQKDGTLVLDAAKLKTAIASSASDVAAVFAQTGRASDSLVAYSGAGSATRPGSYAVNVTQLATRGNTVGSAPVADLTIDGTNNTLQVLLDGVSATVTLDANTYASADALALEVQSKINGASVFSSTGRSITASNAGGVITLTSSRYGSDSSVTVTGGNGASNLLGGSPVATTGVNVAGTLGGVAATGTEQTLTGATGNDAGGLRILVSGGSTGSRGSIDFSQGYAFQLNRLATQFVDTTGVLALRTDGINASIDNLDKQRDQVNTRLALIEKRYRTQFTALDKMLSSMNQTSTFLTQQIDSFNASMKG
jgi:flagellar hook-associated protein 2